MTRVPSTNLDRIRQEIFAPLGQAVIELSARYSEAELAAISSYLIGLTEILRQQTERLTANMVASGSSATFHTRSKPLKRCEDLGPRNGARRSTSLAISLRLACPGPRFSC